MNSETPSEIEVLNPPEHANPTPLHAPNRQWFRKLCCCYCIPEIDNIPQDLLNLIGKLQAKERVYPDSKYPTSVSILQNMETHLKPIIKGSLSEIYRNETNVPFVELICHAFFHRQKHIDRDKRGTLHTHIGEPLDQLYGLLVAAYVSKIKRKIDSNAEQAFIINHRYFEDRAYELFDEMYRSNYSKLEYHILAYNYESKLTGVQDEHNSRELLCVAYRGKCKTFLSHAACQKYIEHRWKSGNIDDLFASEKGNEPAPRMMYKNDSNVTNSVPNIPQQSPIQVGEDKRRSTLGDGDAMKESYITHPPTSSIGRTLRNFFTSPRFKWIIHLIFKIIYVLGFGYVIVEKPYLGKTFSTSQKFPLYVFTYVTLTSFVEWITQLIKIIFIFVKKPPLVGRTPIFWWDFLIMRLVRAVPLTLLVIFTPFYIIYNQKLGGIFFGLIEILYNIVFVLSALSLLKYLSSLGSLEDKIELLKKMVKSIMMYMLLLFFFWAIYAAVYLSLTEARRIKDVTLAWHLFENAAFEMLGEPKEGDRMGTVSGTSNCSDIFWRNVNWTSSEEVSCLFRSTLLPPVLLIYMFVAAVVLINILTAMLSHEYEKKQEHSKNFITFNRYHVLTSFESKFLLPAPFTALLLLVVLYHWLFLIVNCCYTCKYDIVPWKWLSTPKGIGPKNIKEKVNVSAIKRLAADVSERKRDKNFVDLAQAYLNNLEKKPGIKEAQKVFQGITNEFNRYIDQQCGAVHARILTSEAQIMERKTTLVTLPPNISEVTLENRRRNSSGNLRSRSAMSTRLAEALTFSAMSPLAVAGNTSFFFGDSSEEAESIL